MKDKIGLYLKDPNRIVGCYKVIHNLLDGMKELDIQVNLNKKESLMGCLQGIKELGNGVIPTNALIGPEIMVLPTEMPNLFNRYKFWTQPSQWVVNYYKTFPETTNAEFHVWPVGIDTKRFNTKGRTIKSIQKDCFIYYKNVTKQTPIEKLEFVKKELDKRKISYRVLEYGKYEEDDLIDLTKQCKFAISLVGTESQGIAYMEILSSGVPFYVFDEKTFEYNRRKKNFKYMYDPTVSSCPYWDDRCGMKVNELTFNRFDEFLNNLDNYKPRDYILENHTLKMGAKKYYDILLKINGRK